MYLYVEMALIRFVSYMRQWQSIQQMQRTVAIAETIAGSETEFLKLMNKKQKNLV